MVKALVLGGAGFIGYHLVSGLAAQGDVQITIVDNLSRGQLDPDLERLLTDNNQIDLVAGDLTRTETFDLITDRFDRVYLLAGVVGVRNVESQPAKVLHTNTNIVLNTLEWVKNVGCGRLLYASTSETYAASVEQGTGPVPTGESVPIGVMDVQHPRATYAISKILGEAAVTHYSQDFGFEAVIVRYHNVYGPRMGFEHVIPEWMDKLSRRMDPMPVYGREQTRAFCYVTDAVDATQELMTCPLERCELVNVGNDDEIAIGKLLEKVLDVAQFQPKIQSLPAPSGAVSRRCPDISKLRSLTGFEPVVPLDTGLSLTWDWYGSNRSLQTMSDALPSSVHE